MKESNNLNPEKSELLAIFKLGAGEDEDSPTFISEGIYKNIYGEFFIEVKGGSETEYGVEYENERYPSCSIYLINKTEIIKWIGKNAFWLRPEGIAKLLLAIKSKKTLISNYK